ncbi:MAG: SEC-C domain-containing protein, partial [Pseudomonadales bacterium]|nr:SEC-C domain-containing protein [Pseudomonadales bacterium]
QRNELMEAEDISEMLSGIQQEVVQEVISAFIPMQSLEEQWDLEGLEEDLKLEFGIELPIRTWLDADDDLNEDGLREKIIAEAKSSYAYKEAQWQSKGVDIRLVEKQLMLQILDQLWKEHLATMDHLRQGIHLRAYAQKQPKQEYKRESFELFQQLLQGIKHDIIRLLSRVQIESDTDVEKAEQEKRTRAMQRMNFQHQEAEKLNGPSGPDKVDEPVPERAETFVRQERKVGRNEPCPCGSEKKFKHCHGKA